MAAERNDYALLAHVGFRVRTAVGGTLGVVALLAATFPTWFSDHRGAGNAPASGLIDHWNLWLIASQSQGGGGARTPDGHPAGFAIGTTEVELGELAAAVLLATVVLLAITAAEGRWGFALTTAIAAIATVAAETILRVVGDGDHQGEPGPHAYDAGTGLTLSQLIAVAVALWALYVMVVARQNPAPN